MIQLNFLGAFEDIGASGIFVDTGAEKLVLDYGADSETTPATPPLPAPGKVDALLLSHAHLDHCGSVPLLATKKNGADVYAHPCTKELTNLLLLDSVKINLAEIGDIEEGKLPFDKDDVKNTMKKFVDVKYRKPFKVHSSEVTYFDAGHIPGSAMISLKTQGKNILFNGNCNTIDTRLLKGCDMDMPKIDCLITESTYAEKDHPDRKKEEENMVNLVKETVANEGIALVSGFAIGRLQEILLILHNYKINCPIYMDGMAKKATTIINQYKTLLKNPKEFDRALSEIRYLNKDKERSKAIREPCVILTTSGMLSGGPVVWYLRKLYNDRKSSLIMSGFQVPDTPGHKLLNTGRFIHEEEKIDLKLDMFVKRFDFSAHLGRKELLGFIEKTNPEKVFCVHGDRTVEFAEELKGKGFDAVAPTANNRIFNLE